MFEVKYFDKNYSTTSLLTKEKPILEQKPEYKIESKLFLPPNSERKGEGGLRTKGYFKKSYDNKPLISVVTVVYNGEKYLEQTIKSVIGQTYDNIEYIIIDGGSTDETLDIIKKHEDQIDYWVSEPDEGISDAFNKGILLATGEYLNFLNAGDLYINKHILQNMKKYFREPNKIVTAFSKFGRHTIPSEKPDNNDILFKKAYLSHQASFIHLELFKKYGLYSTSYNLRMDYEWWMRVLRENDFLFIDDIIIDYAEGGISGSNRFLFFKEEFQADLKYLPVKTAFPKMLRIMRDELWKK